MTTLTSAIEEFLDRDDRVGAVKHYRIHTGCDLREAVDFVNGVKAESYKPYGNAGPIPAEVFHWDSTTGIGLENTLSKYWAASTFPASIRIHSPTGKILGFVYSYSRTTLHDRMICYVNLDYGFYVHVHLSQQDYDRLTFRQ
jgi:hypothetical protein